MSLPLDSPHLLCVWDFLGAMYIKSDLHLALQSHAAERQFNNWIFHALIDEQVRHVFDTIDFFSSPAHPCLSARLQNTKLTLLVLRCLNKDLREKSLPLLQMKDVDPYDFVCASRNIEFPCRILSQLRNLLNDVRRREEREEFRNYFIDGIRQDEKDQQRKRICKLQLLEDSLEKLIPMSVAIVLKVLYYEEMPQTQAFHRVFNGQVFTWMQCVERWGHDFETSELYEWFVQLELQVEEVD